MFNNELFSAKIRQLEPYEPNKAPCKVRLDANESCFDMPENILDEFKESLDTLAFNRYPDPDATDLCKAFAEFYGVDAANVVAGNGSDELLSVIANSLMGKGDVILTTKPDFSMYAFYGNLAELKCESINKNADFSIDFQALDEKIKSTNAKLVIFSNPCNPTGRLKKKSDIQALIKNNPSTVFVLDEAYLDFACMRDFGVICDDRYSFLHDTALYPNMFVIKTLSKAFGSAALRVGFAVGDGVVSAAFKKVKSPYNVNTVSQMFGKIVLSHGDEIIKRTAEMTKSADALIKMLCGLGFEAPTIANTNFAFVHHAKAWDIYNFACKNGVFIRYFNIFEKPYLRISAGTKEENAVLEALIKQFMEENA